MSRDIDELNIFKMGGELGCYIEEGFNINMFSFPVIRHSIDYEFRVGAASDVNVIERVWVMRG